MTIAALPGAAVDRPDDYYEDSFEDDDEEDDLGDDCGRWRNGSLGSWRNCLMAGTEFCDWECPYGGTVGRKGGP